MLEINVLYDSSVTNLETTNPTVYSEFTGGVAAAAQALEALIPNSITVTIDVGYGEIDGQSLGSDDLGESETNWVSENYSSVRSALIAENAPGSSTLPAASPDQGTLELGTAQAKALGLAPNNGSLDGYVGFSSSLPFSYASGVTPSSGEYYFIGVVEHEMTEVMGRVSLIDDQPDYYSLMDLYRYSGSGVRDLAASHQSNSTAYFSINGGVTNLGSWNNNPSNGDLGDWYPSGPAPNGDDAFNDYSDPGVINQISPNDATLLGALGFTGSNSSSQAVVVSSVMVQPSTGDYGVGKTTAISLEMSGAVTVSGGTPSLALNDGASASYNAAASTSTSLVFDYTVASNQNTSALAVTGVVNGATIASQSGGSANLSAAVATFNGLEIDTTAPALTRDNTLSLSGGTTAAITPALLQFTDNLSSDAQETYTITSAPQDGTLLLNGSPASSFTQANVDNGLLSYEETRVATADSFTFTVADAAGNTTAAEQFQIHIASDAPFLVTDNPLSLTGGTTEATIGPNQLRFGIAGLPTQETYTITSAPQDGTVLLNGSPTNSFTQAEINAGQVSYEETGPATSDTMGFTVSDPAGFTTGAEQLQINIASDVPFQLTDNPLSLSAGTEATIGPSQLRFAIAGLPTQETYTITGAPQDGTVLLNGLPTNSFTQAEINAGQVSYEETGPATSDTMGFTVSDPAGFTTGAEQLQINIASDVPFLLTDNPLSLSAGTEATIGPNQLRFGIAGLPTQETYTITGAPQDGTVLLNGSPTPSFTQAEINAGQVSYEETGPATSDTMGFTVSDPAGFTTGAEQLQINIASDVPFLVSDNPLSLSAGTTAMIGPSQLQFGIAGPPTQETYTVTGAPQEGTLLLNGSAVSSFTQAEINNGQVSYRETGVATSDSFGFTVSDSVGYTTSSQLFQIHIA